MNEETQTRQLIHIGYALQLVRCLAGAVLLWSAIDRFILGAALMSAIMTAIAYLNALSFVRGAERMNVLKAILSRIEEEKRRGPP